jgi:phenylalanyl-tRNA synthetase beta chain
MIVSYEWLKKLVKIETTPEEFVKQMSLHSTEIETYHPLTVGNKLVVGKVLDCVAHPNSDHLHVCKVDIGTEVLQIVCGAPNVATGEKVIVALVGCSLLGGDIKPSKIRGIESNGMLCSLQELGIPDKCVPEKYNKGIFLLDEDAPLGVDPLTYLGLRDEVYELGLTPNRMDLLSMFGVANDVSCVYQQPKTPFTYELKEEEKSTQEEVQVKLETENCISYVCRVVKGVEIKDSPTWLQARLIASGVRPINNVVDISNYIMLLYGQPLHFFDQDLMGNKIVVRMAKEKETCTTIDQKERVMNDQDIVISNGDEIGCIAGVMGCTNKSIHDNTKNIIIESAVFDSTHIRKTSQRLNLRSEASTRYERGVDLNQSEDACSYAAYLLETLAGGKVLKGCCHEGTTKIENKNFVITEKYIEDYLGISIPKETLADIFCRLGFSCKVGSESVEVSVPHRRMDIVIEQDLVEEIGRIYGYDYLKKTFPLMNVFGALTKDQKIRRETEHLLAGFGLNEVVTYSLVTKKMTSEFAFLYDATLDPICLLHPISEDHAYLRRSLIPSLINVAIYNNYRKIENEAIYEIGKCYEKATVGAKEDYHLAGFVAGNQGGTLWQGKKEEVDFYYVKGLLDAYFTKMNLKVTYQTLHTPVNELHPGRSAEILLDQQVIGYLGGLHPTYEKQMDVEAGYVFEINLEPIFAHVNNTTSFVSIPKAPTVYRDFAFVMASDLEVGTVVDAIYHTDRMISNVEVFDVYSGANILVGKKSVAMRIAISSDETLTDDAIQEKVKRILKGLEYRYQITLRQ